MKRLEKLAALVLLPRVHLIRSSGCLALHSLLRGAIIPTPRQQGADRRNATTGSSHWSKARRLQRVFALDMARAPCADTARSGSFLLSLSSTSPSGAHGAPAAVSPGAAHPRGRCRPGRRVHRCSSHAMGTTHGVGSKKRARCTPTGLLWGVHCTIALAFPIRFRDRPTCTTGVDHHALR